MKLTTSVFSVQYLVTRFLNWIRLWVSMEPGYFGWLQVFNGIFLLILLEFYKFLYYILIRFMLTLPPNSFRFTPQLPASSQLDALF